jgi:hypothetical protein
MRRDTARLQCRPEIASSSNLPICKVFDLSSTVRCDHARFGQLLRRNIVILLAGTGNTCSAFLHCVKQSAVDLVEEA